MSARVRRASMEDAKSLRRLKYERIVKIARGLRTPRTPGEPRLRGVSITRYLRRPEPNYRKILRMSLRDWLTYHQHSVVFESCTWMGIPAWKSPLDAWIYQEILFEVRPDVVVELGSAHGGSTLYLANILDLLGNGVVVSVDIDRTNFKVTHDRIVRVDGDSTAPQTLQTVGELCADKRVLVIHDADHRRAQVREDLDHYARLVNVGSYLIVEDGIIDLYRPHEPLAVAYEGPLPAIADFLGDHPEFVIDKSRERYLLTYNPNGFLKRIR